MAVDFRWLLAPRPSAAWRARSGVAGRTGRGAAVCEKAEKADSRVLTLREVYGSKIRLGDESTTAGKIHTIEA